MGNTIERLYIDGIIFNRPQYDGSNSQHCGYYISIKKGQERKLMKSKKQPPSRQSVWLLI